MKRFYCFFFLFLLFQTKKKMTEKNGAPNKAWEVQCAQACVTMSQTNKNSYGRDKINMYVCVCD